MFEREDSETIVYLISYIVAGIIAIFVVLAIIAILSVV